MKLILLMIGILLYGRCNVDVDTYIPKNAKELLPLVNSESKRLMKNFTYYPYFPALIEHESCITLCSKRCWNAKSRLKTAREEGAGLGQLTRAWKHGKLRFDTLNYLKRKYRKELNDLTWNNVYTKPKLQIRAMILLWNQNYRRLPIDISNLNKIAFSDASYNQGFYRTYKDRQYCKLTKGCNPKVWFNNVEKSCTASHKVLYGNRSACDISRHHVRDVMRRSIKYYFYYLDNNYTRVLSNDTKTLVNIKKDMTRE